jgi:predicted HicB family RNase H-like nuclease
MKTSETPIKNRTLDHYLSLPYRLEIVPDAEEGGFTAWYPDLPGCITTAETMDDILHNALDAKKAWIEAALDTGVEIAEPIGDDPTRYSGQFKLRIPKSLHMALSVNARREGISMNQYCIYLLSKTDAILPTH